MLPYIASAIVGAVFMGRTKPKTKMRKSMVFGPRTGTLYTVEELQDSGYHVVHAPDGSIGLFLKIGPTPFQFVGGKGSAATVELMKKDLLP